MPVDTQSPAALRNARKFHDPMVTARGERRAWVAPSGLATLWINTGTLCNITCRYCYIESSFRNNVIVYITPAVT
jgi:DNA repair photolyase